MTRKRQIDHYAARGLRELEARQAWEAYVKSGRKPDDIPARPDLVYASEWRGWVDWLGWDVKVDRLDVVERRQVNLMGALERSLREDREAIAEEKRDKIARRKVKLTRKEIDTFVESDRRWKRKE